ncbi:secretin and TonB N-terminal domain-containing protein [Variovorax sp. LT2P21]|uniref:secretin and TonB N-terminal domain-containing protein n=1 Tax=Variovorax sp. LT2P21 TaxID=3443731 RepID=UPI003F4752B1
MALTFALACRLVRACCVTAALLTAWPPAWADVVKDFGDASPQTHFDLPAQPLEKALAEFGRLTGHSVLVDSAMTRGLTAQAVRGELAAREALGQLLAGTGLSARYSGRNAFTLVPQPEGSAPSAPIPFDTGAPDVLAQAGMGASAVAEFAGALQATIMQAMCTVQPATFGRYRAVLQLWIGPEGRVRRARLLESSGQKSRDAELLEQVQRLSIGHALPPELPQPLTVLLSPRPHSTGPCDAASAAGD